MKWHSNVTVSLFWSAAALIVGIAELSLWWLYKVALLASIGLATTLLVLLLRDARVRRREVILRLISENEVARQAFRRKNPAEALVQIRESIPPDSAKEFREWAENLNDDDWTRLMRM